GRVVLETQAGWPGGRAAGRAVLHTLLAPCPAARDHFPGPPGVNLAWPLQRQRRSLARPQRARRPLSHYSPPRCPGGPPAGALSLRGGPFLRWPEKPETTPAAGRVTSGGGARVSPPPRAATAPRPARLPPARPGAAARPPAWPASP